MEQASRKQTSRLAFSHWILILLAFCDAFGQVVFAQRSRSTGRKQLDFRHAPVSDIKALGQRADLNCEANYQEAEQSWWFNGKPMDLSRAPGSMYSMKNHLFITLPSSEHGSNSAFTVNDLRNGRFQCVIRYRDQALVSEPVQIIVATLDHFPSSSIEDTQVSVKQANVAVIPCNPPAGAPKVVTEFIFNNTSISQSDDKYQLMPSGNLQIFNANADDSGMYRCVAHNPYLQEKRNATVPVALHVETVFYRFNSDQYQHRNIQFLASPLPLYREIRGSNLTMECAASSILPVNISWTKIEGDRNLPIDRHEFIGGNLRLIDILRSDQGVYECKASNGYKSISSKARLEVKEMPSFEPSLQSKKVTVGEQVIFNCKANGNPKPNLDWFINAVPITAANDYKFGCSVRGVNYGQLVCERVKPDLNQSLIQCFASNEVASKYLVAKLIVLDVKQDNNRMRASIESDATNTLDRFSRNEFSLSSRFDSDHNRRKPSIGPKKRFEDPTMPAPLEPTLTRLSAESVMVRWAMPEKRTRLPVSFFKIQYKQLSSKNNGGQPNWITLDEDIAPHIFAFSVSGLQAKKTYKFRIAAVYSNNDGIMSSNSEKFTLRKLIHKRPNLIPTIVQGKAISGTAIELIWKYDSTDWSNESKNISIVPIDGFYIHYRLADSAEAFHKANAEGNQTRTFVIGHLSPGKKYDIRIQSYNRDAVSDFSKAEYVKTLPSSESGNSDDDDKNGTGNDSSLLEEDDEESSSIEDNNSIESNSNTSNAEDSNGNYSTQSNMDNGSIENANNLDNFSNEDKAKKTNENTISVSDGEDGSIYKLSKYSAFYLLVCGSVILSLLILIVCCVLQARRYLAQKKQRNGHSKVDLKYECNLASMSVSLKKKNKCSTLSLANVHAMDSSFSKVNNSDFFYSNQNIVGSNSHLPTSLSNVINSNGTSTSSAGNYGSSIRKNRNQNKSNAGIYGTIGAQNGSRYAFRNNDVHDSSTMNIRVNRFCEDSVANSSMSINRNAINRESYRMSTSMSQHNLTKNQIHNRNLLLPDGANNSRYTSTLDRHHRRTSIMNSKPFEDHYGTNTQFATINRSNSFARLNGTLERKRKSRNDLFTVLDIKENEPMVLQNGAALRQAQNRMMIVQNQMVNSSQYLNQNQAHVQNQISSNLIRNQSNTMDNGLINQSNYMSSHLINNHFNQNNYNNSNDNSSNQNFHSNLNASQTNSSNQNGSDQNSINNQISNGNQNSNENSTNNNSVNQNFANSNNNGSIYGITGHSNLLHTSSSSPQTSNSSANGRNTMMMMQSSC